MRAKIYCSRPYFLQVSASCCCPPVADLGRFEDGLPANFFLFLLLFPSGVLNRDFVSDGAVLGRRSDSGALCSSRRFKSTGLNSLALSFFTTAFATIMLLLSGLFIGNL